MFAWFIGYLEVYKHRNTLFLMRTNLKLKSSKKIKNKLRPSLGSDQLVQNIVKILLNLLGSYVKKEFIQHFILLCKYVKGTGHLMPSALSNVGYDIALK